MPNVSTAFMKYVSLIQNGRIQTSAPSNLACSYANDKELADLVSSLIDEGFAFVDEPAGWPPAAILQSLQEQGLLKRAFTSVTWSSPESYLTYEVFPC